MTIFFIIISLGTISMIEFYYAKDNDRLPILAIKKEYKSLQYVKYASVFYDVYSCYSGTIIIRSKNADETYCPRIVKFDDEGYYTNINGLKISKKDYQMMYDVSITKNEIENLKNKEDIDNFVFVAETYQRSIYKIKENNIAVFREFEISNIYGDYSWVFKDNKEEYYKCYSVEGFKDYSNGKCLGEWKKYEYSNKWCSLAKDSMLYKIKNVYNQNCK